MDDLSIDDLRLLLAAQRMELAMDEYRNLLLSAGQSLERKTLACELNAMLEEGEFDGYAAIKGILDDQGDVIAPSAFRDGEAPRTLPLLWNHDPNAPLGVVELTDTPTGLKVRGKLNLGVEKAKEVYALLKQGAVRGLSIGYNTLKATWRDGARHLLAMKLLEVSLTPFPAQPLAVVEAVKAQDQSRQTEPHDALPRAVQAAAGIDAGVVITRY